MSVESKRKLSTICYYTLAILTFAVSCLSGYALIIRSVTMWAKVVYFIWLAVVLGTVVFDVICTHNNQGKEITGLIIYVLSILSIIVAAILYSDATLFFLAYFMFGVPILGLGFVGYGKQKKLNKEAQA